MSCEYCLEKNKSKHYFLRSLNSATHSLYNCTHIYGEINQLYSKLHKIHLREDFNLPFWQSWLSRLSQPLLKRLLYENNGSKEDLPREKIEELLSRIVLKNTSNSLNIMIHKISTNNSIVTNTVYKQKIQLLSAVFFDTYKYFDLLKLYVKPIVFTRFINVLTQKFYSTREELKESLCGREDYFRDELICLDLSVEKLKNIIMDFKVQKYGPLFVRLHYNRDIYRKIMSFI